MSYSYGEIMKEFYLRAKEAGIEPEDYNMECWAYAFKLSESKNSKILYCKPTKGIIKEDGDFRAYNKRTKKILKKRYSTGYARSIAFTERDAIRGYNETIDSYIQWHEKNIKDLEGEKII